MKDEFNPEFFTPITTPSNACNLVLSPSRTLTETTTVSPGLNSGRSDFNCLDSKSSMICDGVFSTRETFNSSSAGTSASSAGVSSSTGASSAGASSSTGASSAGGY